MLHLKNVTLLALAATDFDGTINALVKSQEAIRFAAAKLITPVKPADLPAEVQWEECPPLRLRAPGIDDYSHYCIYDLWRHVETEHALVVQADGYVVNPGRWSMEFLEYDYIGAPWPVSESAYLDPFGVHQRVGNGGFSLRSHRLLTVPKETDVIWNVNDSDFYKHMDAGLLHEDGNICVHNRHVFEAAGCRFAPVEVAVRFSQEHYVPEMEGIEPFGFHRYPPGTAPRPGWRSRLSKIRRHR